MEYSVPETSTSRFSPLKYSRDTSEDNSSATYSTKSLILSASKTANTSPQGDSILPTSVTYDIKFYTHFQVVIQLLLLPE